MTEIEDMQIRLDAMEQLIDISIKDRLEIFRRLDAIELSIRKDTVDPFMDFVKRLDALESVLKEFQMEERHYAEVTRLRADLDIKTNEAGVRKEVTQTVEKVIVAYADAIKLLSER